MQSVATIRVGMVGLGMIFDETYRPLFERLHVQPLYDSTTGPVSVQLAAACTRTGRRGTALQVHPAFAAMVNVAGDNGLSTLLDSGVDAVCVATPDDRHYTAAKQALVAGKHVLIEKPSVLSLRQLDDLVTTARQSGVLAKVVYHKLLDPDHKRLRTLVTEGVLQTVTSGYCSLLEPKSVGLGQFAEWNAGRNPATYVAVHYFKLIDFTFGPKWQLRRIAATGQRGLVGEADGLSWDSVQVRLEYEHPGGRTAGFDVHTSWVMPDNFPGYVEQEVQFRFDNAVWNAHQRRRGVELAIEGRTPDEFKNTPNHHYNARVLEPWGERTTRGYGLEAVERFFREVAFVEYGGLAEDRPTRLEAMRALAYNDIAADRNVVACVQAVEAILGNHAAGRPGGVVEVNLGQPGLWWKQPGEAGAVCLYDQRV